MEYKVDYKELCAFFESLKEKLSELQRSKEVAWGRINALINSSNISGETADRMRNYFRDVHITILERISDVRRLILNQYTQYLYAYISTIDANYNARFSSGEFSEKVVPALQEHVYSADYIDGRVRGILREIQDIFSPSTAFHGVDGITELLQSQMKSVRALDEEIQDLETTYESNGMAQIEELLDTISVYIKENQGHNHFYMTTYDASRQSESFHRLNQYQRQIEAYFALRGKAYNEMAQVINGKVNRWYQDKLNVENQEELEAAAFKVRLLGYVGDFCIAGIGLAFMGMGIPEPAVKIVGGTAGGGWKGYYTSASEQLENYCVGDGELVKQDELGKSIAVESVKGGTSGVISFGAGQLFENIGDNAFVYKLTESKNPIIKHGSNLSLKFLEKEFVSIDTGITDRVIDTTADIADGKEQFSVKAYWDDIKLATVWQEEIQEGGMAKTAAEVVTGYIIDEKYKSNIKETIKNAEDLEASHTWGRTFSKAGIEGIKSIAQETTGEFAASAASDWSVQAGIDSVVDLYTDKDKAASMVGEAASDSILAAFKDRGTQQNEAAFLERNRAEDARLKATEALGRLISVPVDNYGYPDYSKTQAIYCDTENKIKADVDVETYGVLNYEQLCRKAEQKYGSRIGNNAFKTPDGYKWVMKFDSRYGADVPETFGGKEFGSQEVTLQLVRTDKLPNDNK